MCEHEYENDNCTNCANGLGILEYECAKTQGRLKEYCHERALAREKQIRADAIEEFARLIHEDLYQLNHHQVDFLAEQLKENTNE